MKWYPPKPEKPKPCSGCHQGVQIVGKLCGFCFSAFVDQFEKRSRKSRLTVR